jgi:integrase
MLYPPGLFFQAIILVAYDTGLRLRALLGIRRCDWKPERREITADATVMKHKVSQTFQVSEQTQQVLTLMLNNPKSADEQPTLLFPWPVRHDGIHEAYRKILMRAGLYTKEQRGSFHKLRRTSATHLTNVIGIEAACRQLGHSSVEMTKRYVDPRLTNEHKAADHLPRPEKG